MQWSCETWLSAELMLRLVWHQQSRCQDLLPDPGVTQGVFTGPHGISLSPLLVLREGTQSSVFPPCNTSTHSPSGTAAGVRPPEPAPCVPMLPRKSQSEGASALYPFSATPGLLPGLRHLRDPGDSLAPTCSLRPVMAVRERLR